MERLLTILLLISSQTMAQKLVIKDHVRFLALGDSYTIGESVPVTSRWPFQLIDSLHSRGIDGLEPSIIATTGWRTDDLKRAISKAKLKPEYSLVSLLIGVNNFYQNKTVDAFAPEFEELLLTAIRLAKGNKSSVFVVSIPDYGYTPFGKESLEKITKGIDAFNEASKKNYGKTRRQIYQHHRHLPPWPQRARPRCNGWSTPVRKNVCRMGVTHPQ